MSNQQLTPRVTAAGSGCQAALDAEWYLRDTPVVGELSASAREG